MKKMCIDTLNSVYGTEQYFHIVPTKLYHRDRLKELETIINNSSINNIKAGDNIKIDKSKTDNTYTINVKLSKDISKKYVNEELNKGNDLDVASDKMMNAINENADAINGELIEF